MARTMIEIEPGSESWDAWIEHHKGTRTELVMVKCRHDARPFMAWSEFPPEQARADGLSRAPKVQPPNIERSFNVERDVGEIAGRLEARTERNEAEAVARTSRKERLARIELARERAAAAVQIGAKPSLKELDDVGIVMIDDPFEVKNGRKPKPLRAKLVNLRDDPVGQMEKRGQIEAEQLQAGRKWQNLYDVAHSIGGSRGIDYSNAKVDGGRLTDPLSDRQIDAIKELERIDALLGCVGASLVCRVLGERMTVSQVATMMGKAGERGVSRTGDRLRECLETLVAIMGVETKGKGKRPPRDGAAELSRFADNPLLYQAVRSAGRKIV